MAEVKEEASEELKNKGGGSNKIEIEHYLKSTSTIDCDNGIILARAQEVTDAHEGTIEKARSLFYFVRDEIKYNPYVPRHLPEHFRASNILAQRQGFCIQKAILLVALSRAVGIPARLGFAVIRNHLIPEKLGAILKTNITTDHGYAELYLDGRWVKTTPAFDREMCQNNRIIPVEFDGRNDAKFHSHNRDGKLHIEYLVHRGPYDDAPLDEIREWVASILRPEAKNMILGNESER